MHERELYAAVERFDIDVLQATQTVKGAQGILGTTWDETWHVLRRAVARGQARKAVKPMPCIGIDEKAFRKGQNEITLLYDLNQSTVEAISDGNDTESGAAAAWASSSGSRVRVAVLTTVNTK